ncbi:MAG: PilN domain-containing protein, partial [Holophaga sp.]|nr:PilN domain-containing protein [Holophaga sp.]
MAVPALKLDLAPPSNLWRNNHITLGWAALALGGLILAGSLALTWKAYHSAAITGKLAGNLDYKTRATAADQSRIMAELRSVDVAKELPRWRLAERIYTERSLPWSRLTAELERSLAQDVRVKSIQRNRSTDMKVQLKLKGEARSREAEADFVEALQKNPFFEQVILEREGERQGGGVDFDYTLAVSSNPPPYRPLPKVTPPPRHPAARPAPAKVPAPAPRGAQPPSRNVQPPYRGIAVPPP